MKLFREASWHPAFVQCILFENSNKAHARRGLAEVVKATGKEAGKNTLAYKILVKISEIFDLDKKRVTGPPKTASSIEN